MGDDADARDELDRRDEFAVPAVVRFLAVGLLEHVDGAGGERVIGLEEIAPVRGGGDDQDRRRTKRHDVFGGRQAGHHGQHHVHGDDIGAQSEAKLDGLLAVGGLAHDVEFGMGCERRAYPLADGERVFDHEHADVRHGSIHELSNVIDERGLVEFALDHVAMCAGFAPALLVLG